MIFAGKKVTVDDLIKAKQTEYDAAENYKQTSAAYYGDDKCRATKSVEAEICHYKAGRWLREAERAYSKLMDKYKSQNNL